MTNNIQGNSHKVNSDFSAETLQDRREWQDIFKLMNGKNTQQGSHSDSTEKLKPLQTSKS